MSPRVLWDVVRVAAARAGIEELAPHDLRRTCARPCHLAGGEREQAQFLPEHVSVQTTGRYLGCIQKLRGAVDNRPGIEPDAAAWLSVQEGGRSRVTGQSRLPPAAIGLTESFGGKASAQLRRSGSRQ